jgi:hypothetical protein
MGPDSLLQASQADAALPGQVIARQAQAIVFNRPLDLQRAAW